MSLFNNKMFEAPLITDSHIILSFLPPKLISWETACMEPHVHIPGKWKGGSGDTLVCKSQKFL